MTDVGERHDDAAATSLASSLAGPVDVSCAVALPDDPGAERVAESLGVLSDGDAGLRGVREEDGEGTTGLFVVSGVYTDDEVPRLLAGPLWTNLAVIDGGLGGRHLDLRSAMLVRRDPSSGVTSLRFLSAARPGIAVLVADGPADRLAVAPAFREGEGVERSETDGIQAARTRSGDRAGIAVAVRDQWTSSRGRRSVVRRVAWVADASDVPDIHSAARRLDAVSDVPLEVLVDEHRAAWASRWAGASVEIEGAPEDQIAARFAVFHLLSAARQGGESAVGPRGLTGPAYGGHVFWDADVFVLPAVAALAPEAARSMLAYRIARLPAARAAAAEAGFDGARFPWESAGDGRDVTPPHVHHGSGALIPVQTADEEEHIVADVAWGAHELAMWTGDDELLTGPARDLVLDCARYWASRVEVDASGRYHVAGVMGPDEYHPVVDDNVFTNVMARWVLRRGSEVLLRAGGEPAVAERWWHLADRLVDGWDPQRGCHEQFAGYWELEPLVAEQVAHVPFPADLLLGAARAEGSQLVKQADVVMAHHLVPEEMVPGSLDGDIDTYLPRTTHGSSLSPAIHAAVLARARRPDDGLAMFRMAARLDLDDITGTTASGLHLATMGGLWQALAYGFLGLRPRRDHLELDPCLPTAWSALALSLRINGQLVAIRADHGSVRVECSEPLALVVGGGPSVVCEPPGRTFELVTREGTR